MVTTEGRGRRRRSGSPQYSGGRMSGKRIKKKELGKSSGALSPIM